MIQLEALEGRPTLWNSIIIIIIILFARNTKIFMEGDSPSPPFRWPHNDLDFTLYSFLSKVQVQNLPIYLYAQRRGESHIYACRCLYKAIIYSM